MNCKRRRQDEQLHRSSSLPLPKRPFASSSEADSSTLCNSHGNITSSYSDCISTGGCGLEQSTLLSATNTPARTLNSNYKFGTLASNRESPRDGQQTSFFGTYHVSNNHGSMDSEAEASAVVLSELTVDRSAHTLSSSYEPEQSGHVTHVISKREAGTFSTEALSREPCHKMSCGYGDYATSGRQVDKSRMPLGPKQSRDKVLLSTGCEKRAPYQNEVYLCGEITSKHGSANVAHISKAHPSIAWTDNRGGHRCSSSEALSQPSCASDRMSLHPDFLPQCVVSSDRLCEDPGASYVLSSGRLSLEEEARLGRRAPTIDHDFEEYFAALML